MKIAIPLCFAFVLWSGLAIAGTLNRSHDADSMLNLSSGDVAQLQQDVGKVPFDVRLLVESAPSVSALGNDAHQAIEGFPNSMVIAIDPAGHIAVRFGKGVGVKPGDFDSISKSGNAHFHNHEWVAGIETIVLRARVWLRRTRHLALQAQSEGPRGVQARARRDPRGGRRASLTERGRDDAARERSPGPSAQPYAGPDPQRFVLKGTCATPGIRAVLTPRSDVRPRSCSGPGHHQQPSPHVWEQLRRRR